MAGFMKVAWVGEHYGQSIVNILHYRSTQYDPLGGDPFADMLSFMDGLLQEQQSEFLAIHNANYRLLRLEGTVFTNDYTVVNSSPAVRTVDLPGSLSGNALETTGSSVCAILGFNMGSQHQINGVGQSKRNRGYLALGPVPEIMVDSYGHFVGGYDDAVSALGAKLDNVLVDILQTSTFTPIRIHEKWQSTGLPVGPKRILINRTYSDIIGYRVPRVASWRKSRQPEA